MTAITTISIPSDFNYEPLPYPSSSIRLAILHPGSRESPVKVTLQNSTFTSRPKYKALSYTWGSPDVTKVIKLNGQTFKARKNLWDALVHLRHETEERSLWIDAICIDQSNVRERNQQVGLMAYIYTRAEMVIVWLGSIRVDYNSAIGEVDFASPLATQEQSLICVQPYWKRVWIVQEIGAATDLEVHWETISASLSGSMETNIRGKAYLWDRFFTIVRANLKAELPTKLHNQREKRYGDAFLLPNLMSVNRNSLCVEPRDKIYGFVGIAHDCQDGSLEVDYSRSLFQLYADAVRFQYKASSVRPGKKSIDVVCFSQLTQELLGGKQALEEDFTQWSSREYSNPSSVPLSLNERVKDDASTLKIAGRYSGKIAIIGPPYEEMIGMPDAMRRWKVLLSKCTTGLETLRKKNDHFMRTLLEIDDNDLRKIAPLEVPLMSKMSNLLLKALKFSKDDPKIFDSLPQTIESSPIETPNNESGHRLFATLDGVIGIIPPSAQIGDLLFQYLDSDVVVVARMDDDWNYCQIVGRAVVANAEYTGYSTFQKPSDFLDPSGKGYGMDFEGTTIPLDVDLMTLHLLTC